MLNEPFVPFTESEEVFGNPDKSSLPTASPVLSNISFELSINAFLKHASYEA